MTNDFKEIQKAVDNILNVKTYVRRKKKTASDKRKEIFVQIINSLEEIHMRENLMYADMDIDMFKYDEKFLGIVDALIYLNFGEECAEIVGFYLYDRINQDGSINPLIDAGGTETILNNPYDLWNLLVLMNPKIQD